ncbi:hypothetical protein [Faecalibacter bovis]|uniref:Initiator Rep protein domain-containing protein n=1 Tax=Faecalibacter bovis TaxID=2898187 RepID=A0ABX7XC78_9FLAO|nr:hypothetical protein [Faecalibacter bovis]QTV05502.1 hypothetical protein J9309_12120 [Faecalibacter bovis]
MKQKFNVNHIPALKQEILDLPEKEKNQLLIRLINKDQVLIEQLLFRLLEDEFDLNKRFEDLKTEIESTLNDNYKAIMNVKFNDKGRMYLRLIRGLSSKINHFAKVTKDVNGELRLRTFLLIESTKKYNQLQKEDTVIGYKTRLYQVSKIKTMISLFGKLHEDLKYDYSSEFYEILEEIIVNNLGTEINQSKLKYQILSND